MIRKAYKPKSEEEWALFQIAWCRRCRMWLEGEGCDVFQRARLLKDTDHQPPFIHGDDGPTCMLFRRRDRKEVIPKGKM